MSPSPTHECPAPPCDRQIGVQYLACRRHWHMVPAPLRRALLAAWDGGRGFGSAEHVAARAACVRALERLAI
jgi:hypothetical protein